MKKLQLPNMNLNVAVLGELETRFGGRQLALWVLGEGTAYRQWQVQPNHRKFTLTCFKDPGDGVAKFFVMISHPFGLMVAVYNDNRGLRR